jgi:hypothetical protein
MTWKYGFDWGGLDIKNGGKITVESGGIVDFHTGAIYQFDGVPAAAPWTGLTFDGQNAKAVIDFNTGAAEALCNITINGVVYQEADPAVPANGVWTNGGSAANSCASFIAAVNGDTRAPVPFTAVATTALHSAVLCWDAVGVAGNVAITTTSAVRITVENSISGLEATPRRIAVITYTVTAQDVLADECVIPIPFVATRGVFNYRNAAGLQIFPTCLPSFQINPPRCQAVFAGATDLIATDYICAVVME